MPFSAGLQNDHTDLLRRIEEGLAVVLSPSASANNLDPNGTNAPPPQQTPEPFAKVDHVMTGSPANLAVSEHCLLLEYFTQYTWLRYLRR